MVSFNYGLHFQIGVAPSTTPICCAEDQGEMGRYIRQETHSASIRGIIVCLVHD